MTSKGIKTTAMMVVLLLCAGIKTFALPAYIDIQSGIIVGRGEEKMEAGRSYEDTRMRAIRNAKENIEKVLERQPLDLESLESRTIGDYLSMYPGKEDIIRGFLDSASVYRDVKTKDGRVEVTLLLPVDGPSGYKVMLAKLTGRGGEVTKNGPEFETPRLDDGVKEILKSSVAAESTDKVGKQYKLLVVPFENNSGLGKIDLGGIIEERVISVFSKDPRFTLIYGDDAVEILEDNSLSEEVIHQADVNTKVKIKGADGLLDGVITKFDVLIERHGIGGAGFNEKTYSVEIELRILDSSTGRWIYFDTIPIETNERVFSVDDANGKIPEIKEADFDDTSNLAYKTINEIAKKIESTIRSSFPLMGYVLKVSGDKVYINLTKADSLKDGDYLTVLRIGEELIDPVSGEAIDRIKDRIGTIRAVDVKDTYTQCMTSETPIEEISPGDVVMVK